jgi:hypothetical protein
VDILHIPSDRTPNLSSSLIVSPVILSDSACPNMTPPSSISCDAPSSSTSPSSRSHPHSFSPNVVGKNPDRLNGSSFSVREVCRGVAYPVLACLCLCLCRWWNDDVRGRLVVSPEMLCGADLDRCRDMAVEEQGLALCLFVPGECLKPILDPPHHDVSRVFKEARRNSLTY